MPSFQDPPRLFNAYEADPLLREYLFRHLGGGSLAEVEPELRHLGELAVTQLLELQQTDRLSEPRHSPFDAWGRRVDRIELTPLWRCAAQLSARHGLVAVPYERRWGALSRVIQLALLHVIEPSLDVYSCPLAMSDGAARTLLDLGNADLVARAVPRLTSRDPASVWTSGQWMTERTGGSDVGRAETVARRTPDGWRLYGSKWFCSAITAEMALALARPEGNPPGGRGLALFYLEMRDAEGGMNGILVHRLKDKLGTRKLPTAEVGLEGARAVPVAGLVDGVKNIASMLNVTRLWNAVCSAAGMQRALALARDYARRREAFGEPLAAKPLHADTLAGLEAEREGAFLLAFRAAELLGQREAGEASATDLAALRAVTPLAKLTTGKQAVAVASEALECFGGAGYVEDTGLPRLLRDAQVLPVWEGTTNVLALDLLRALSAEGAMEAMANEIQRPVRAARDPSLRPAAEAALRALEHAQVWMGCSGSIGKTEPRSSSGASTGALEAGARRFALTLGRALEVALLCEHAQTCLDAAQGGRAAAAARRLARHGVDLIQDELSPEDAHLLAVDGA
ncbi:MAG: acyl-CoA dehydrogenase [Anaeromyxobacter sp. RBG_16_69_14]|nr:MAG: acyl-CoA dehydrogenase [Anaeromyxobacter sp. RBG_16_69_14]